MQDRAKVATPVMKLAVDTRPFSPYEWMLALRYLKARRNEAQSAVVDVDESESAESFELPGADLSGEELSVRVIPKQADEFTCSSCFLVHHRSRLASENNGVMICTDCAA